MQMKLLMHVVNQHAVNNQHKHAIQHVEIAGANIATTNHATITPGVAVKNPTITRRNIAATCHNTMKFSAANMFLSTTAKHAAAMFHNTTAQKNAECAKNGYATKSAPTCLSITTSTYATHAQHLHVLQAAALMDNNNNNSHSNKLSSPV